MSFCSVRHTTSPLNATCNLPPGVSRLSPSFASASAFPSSALRHARFSFNPLFHRLSDSRRGVWAVLRAGEEPFDPHKGFTDTLKDVQEAWHKTEDKLALGTLGFSAFLTVWASVGVVSAVDQLPLLPSFFELVGIFYSMRFAYRYLLFKTDREEMREKVDDILSRVVGSSDMY